MLTIYLLLTNIFLLTSPYIIRDLPFNTYYIEDMSQYENKLLSEGTEFFIRFPYNAENEIKFYLILSKNIAIFPIYISEFAENPDETEITKTYLRNAIPLSDQEEETQYIKYSYDITTSQQYQVIYFKNDKNVDYISFFAYSFAENTFSNIPMNQGFYIYSLKNESYYYLKFNISDPDGKILKIITSADINYVPKYELDLKCFYYIPSQYETTQVDYSWDRNISYKLGDDNYTEERTYEYHLSENHICCAIRIYNKNILDELLIHLGTTEKGKTPIWFVVLMGIFGILLIIGVIFLCKKSLNTPEKRKTAAACCIIACLCAWCMASIMNNSRQ